LKKVTAQGVTFCDSKQRSSLNPQLSTPPVQYKDYYATLGVSKTASQDDIRKAFRKLARQHHPDVAKDKKTAESKFKEINEAYEVLGDPEKRQKYDTLGADWEHGGQRQPPPGWGRRGGRGAEDMGEFSFGGTGFSDFFEQFFGGARGHARHSGGFGFPQEEVGGGDVEADLLVSIEEALHGSKKKISLRRGESAKVETYEVRIPKGVREGQRIRLAGQGEAAGGRRPAGDLYLRVRFEQHPDYRVEGSDLLAEVEVPVARLVLGTELHVPTPEGAVKLKIPASTQPGRKFRLKGRGMPSGANARGDLYVQVEAVLPTTLTAEERTHWEALARLSGA
jgi:curved DNA-binding protein